LVAPDALLAGGTFELPVTVTNYGPSTATEIDLLVVPNSGITLLSADPDVCNSDSGVHCDLGELAAPSDSNASTQITLTFAVPGSASGNAGVYVSASHPGTDSVSGNNAANFNVEVGRSADVEVALEADSEVAVPGQLLEYTATVTNLGPSGTDDIVVTFDFDLDVTVIDIDVPGDCVLGSLICSLHAGLDKDASVELGVTVRVAAAAGGPIDTTVSVTHSTDDEVSGNDSDELSTGLGGSANLSLEVEGDADPIAVGDVLTYTATAYNESPIGASGVEIVVLLDDGLTFTSEGSDEGCELEEDEVVCDIGDIEAEGDVEVVIVATAGGATVGTPVESEFALSAAGGDSNPRDNDVTVTTDVAASTDLSIVGEATPDPALAGDVVTLSFTITNEGPAETQDTKIAIELPAGLTPVSASEGWECARVDGGWGCTGAGLAVDADTAIEVMADVSSAAAASLTVVAWAGSDSNAESDTENNIVEVSVSVERDSDRDGYADADDNCPTFPNPDQANSDHDDHGDACDNCLLVDNNDQVDQDGDRMGNACDLCPEDIAKLAPGVCGCGEVDTDDDRDGVCDDTDNCLDVTNPAQDDADEDGVGDDCDNCADAANEDQADEDEDGEGDVCDACVDGADDDGDAVCDETDNCPLDHNGSQLDRDGDGVGDVCDDCPEDADDQCGGICEDGVDDDEDGVCDDVDNCPLDHNGTQLDRDEDGIGDACDDCPENPDADCEVACGDEADDDEDGVCDDVDNCPLDHNGTQLDRDEDGIGDVCDDCPENADPDCEGSIDDLDAGIGSDAGADAGVASSEDFETVAGGGGCDGCSAADGGQGSSIISLLLVGLALVLRRRR